MGLGAGAVDASLNQFVAAHYTSRHMNWLHGFWGVGAATGPIIMGLALAGEGGWAEGARHIGYAQLALAAVLWATLALWRHSPRKPVVSHEDRWRISPDLQTRGHTGTLAIAAGVPALRVR